MSTFLVTGCGHSGTKLLSLQLGEAEDWVVEHEPDEAIAAWVASRRFERAEREKINYGEVNSFLLAAALDVPADRKAVLLRNPYNLVYSIAQPGKEEAVIDYVRGGIAWIESLLSRGFTAIAFKGITGKDPNYVVERARELGVRLDVGTVRTSTVINPHAINREAWESVSAPRFSAMTVTEFDRFIYRYNLENATGPR